MTTPTKSRFLILFLLLTIQAVRAQDSLASKDRSWHFQVVPYLMFPNMNGTMGLGNLPDASLSLSPGDIFSHLQMGAMLYLEAGHDKWVISSDFLYMKLGQDVTPKTPINSGYATMKQTMWELDGLYKLNPWLEVGVGARMNNISGTAELKVATLPPGTENTLSNSLSQTWIDPIIVTRLKAPLKGSWLLQLRTDVGGFGVGSKFAWQIQADAGYRFSDLFQATIGYRYMDVNYASGSGTDRFVYDMSTFGPTVRLGFNF